MVKRALSSTRDVDGSVEHASKRQQKGDVPAAAASDELRKSLNDIHQQLMQLDDKCAKEQIAIQRTYAKKMEPFWAQRQKVYEDIPHFWGTTICKHPTFDDLICKEDREILKHLKCVDLKDNLDDFGSYELTLIFDPEVKAFFSPSRLTKRVEFTKEGDEVIKECTEISFVQGKDPREAVKERLEKSQAQDSAESDEEDECGAYTVFSWFDKDVDSLVDFGEVIRREVWHQPDVYFFSDGADDDEDEDEDENAEEDAEDDAAEK